MDTNLREREQHIQEGIGRPQHVFVEGDESVFRLPAVKSLLSMTLVAPLVGIVAAFHVYFVVQLGGTIVSKFGPENAGRDEELVNHLKAKHDIESQEVDIGISQFISNHKVSSAIVNWGGVAFLSFAIWRRSTLSFSTFDLLLYILIPLVVFILFIKVSLPFRNKHIAETITEAKDQLDRACLVTGEAHHSAVADLLKDEPGINVINPSPENPSILGKISTWIFNCGYKN